MARAVSAASRVVWRTKRRFPTALRSTSAEAGPRERLLGPLLTGLLQIARAFVQRRALLERAESSLEVSPVDADLNLKCA